MKKSILLSCMFVLLSSACKKNNVTPNDPSDTFEENKLEVQMNGSALEFEFISAVRIAENGDTAIVVMAYMDDMASQSLTLTLPMHTGTHQFVDPSTENNGIPSAIFMQSNTQTNVADAGTLNITQHNKTTKRIKGTFQFTTIPMHEGGEPMTFSNGNFDLEYF